MSENLPIRVDREFYLQVHESDNYLCALYGIYGKRFSDYREEWKKAGTLKHLPTLPLHIELEINNYCNLRCRMCHFSQYEHLRSPKADMTLSLLKRLTEQCEGQIPAIGVGAGAECLLHPRIEDILHILTHSSFMDIIVHTNGTCLTPQLGQLLIDLKIPRLNISLDAATPDTYRKIRGGRLDIVEHNLCHLLDEKKRINAQLPYVRLTFVKLPENTHEIPLFLEKWNSHVDRIDFQRLVQLQGEDDNCDTTNPNIDHYCSYPFHSLYVNQNGDVFPCCTYYKRFLHIGNIKQQSIKQIWESKIMNELRNSMKSHKLLSCCRKCLSTTSHDS